MKSRLIGKDLDAGKDQRQEKGMTEDEMVGWHHQLKGHESEPTLGDGDGQGSLAWCSLWGRKESDTTERLNDKIIHSEQNMEVVFDSFLHLIFHIQPISSGWCSIQTA